MPDQQVLGNKDPLTRIKRIWLSGFSKNFHLPSRQLQIFDPNRYRGYRGIMAAITMNKQSFWASRKDWGTYALSLCFHMVLLIGFAQLQSMESAPLTASEEFQLVDIEGHRLGDGLAAKAQAVPVPLTSASSQDAIGSEQSAPVAQAVSSGGTQSIQSGTGQFGVENGRKADLEERYTIELRQLIEKNKTYPLIAKKLGHQGRVLVRFVLNASGEVQKSEIISGASSEVLNKAALDLIVKISGLKPFPEELSKSTWEFEIPIEYKM